MIAKNEIERYTLYSGNVSFSDSYVIKKEKDGEWIRWTDYQKERECLKQELKSELKKLVGKDEKTVTLHLSDINWKIDEVFKVEGEK